MINKPFVTNNTGNNEWYTPASYIDLARQVMGDIDLDPASCAFANKTVQATKFYSLEDNGLEHEWHGRVWMNPPYSRDSVGQFADKFVEEYSNGHITEGIVLVNNSTDSRWFKKLASAASAIVFPSRRIKFDSATKGKSTPLQGQAILYFGEQCDRFLDVFSPKGIACRLIHIEGKEWQAGEKIIHGFYVRFDRIKGIIFMHFRLFVPEECLEDFFTRLLEDDANYANLHISPFSATESEWKAYSEAAM